MATIVMDAQKVIDAANKTIEAINDARILRDESTIARVRNKARIGAWFKTYYPSRNKAIKILDDGDFWGWRSIYAQGDLEHAKKLLVLAAHGDPVTLNEEDTRVLF